MAPRDTPDYPRTRSRKRADSLISLRKKLQGRPSTVTATRKLDLLLRKRPKTMHSQRVAETNPATQVGSEYHDNGTATWLPSTGIPACQITDVSSMNEKQSSPISVDQVIQPICRVVVTTENGHWTKSRMRTRATSKNIVALCTSSKTNDVITSIRRGRPQKLKASLLYEEKITDDKLQLGRDSVAQLALPVLQAPAVCKTRSQHLAKREKTILMESIVNPPERLNESDFKSIIARPNCHILTASFSSTLHPMVTSISLRNREHAASEVLPKCLMQKPCVVLKNFAQAVRIDIQLFFTNPASAEMHSLPPFFHMHSQNNMLHYLEDSSSHTRKSAKLSVHNPGYRMSSQDQNLNFCAINLNLGPGEYEWVCVSRDYFTVLVGLCDQKNVSLSDDCWWPDFTDLYKTNIPVYRFIQHKGELVFTNSGTVYWLRAVSSTKSISWELAPRSVRQFTLSMERFDWNKEHQIKSSVPMLYLTWKMACKMIFAIPQDEELLRAIRKVLYASVSGCRKVFRHLDSTEMELDHAREIETSRFCAACQIEVFNVHFVSDVGAKHGSAGEVTVRCYECAMRADKLLETFKVRYKYSIKELYEIMATVELV